jgi:hypothetical protein
MKNLIYIATLFITTLSATSCQKVVDIDLNSTDPKLVVEAEIKDGYGCRVILSNTVNFDDKNNFPAVLGATIKLTDDAGNSEILEPEATLPGFYFSRTLMGAAGRTYTLQVTVNNKTYTSVAKMPPAVPIDSVGLRKGFFRDANNIVVYFTDPAAVENYYRIVHYVNRNPRNTLDITEDILRDGQRIDATLFVGDEDTLKSGDSVLVYLQNIDKGSYDYYRTMTNADGAGDPGSTPANPLSTFDNGALGYFSAYSQTEDTLVVP